MTEQKLASEEVANLKKLQTNQQTLIKDFGELEYQIQLLEIEKEKLVKNLEKFKQEEKSLANDLNKKYGDGVINLEKEVFQS